MEPSFVHIPYSPWSVRARLALDAQGIAYRPRTYIPTLSEAGLRLKLRRVGGRVTLPILFPADGPPVEDSLDIALWGAARSQRPIVADAERADVIAWNDLASGMLEAGRARTTRRVMADREALTESLPPQIRWMGPVGRVIGRDAAGRLLRKYDAAAHPEEVWRARLADGCGKLRAALGGREWLLGRFTYADLTAAIGLSFVRPHENAPLGPRSRERWTEADLAEEYADLLAWGDRVIAHVRALRAAQARLAGLLLGQAAGDGLGLPYENLGPGRVAKRLGDGGLRPAMLAGRTTGSDDTAHAWAVGQALLESDGDPERFRAALGRRLRAWFLTLPVGIGLATLRAMVRLCVGVPPDRSGVRSAGNGPVMRAPLIGAWAADLDRVRVLVDMSSRITHTDERAIEGARVVAVAAWHVARGVAVSSALEQAASEARNPELVAALSAPPDWPKGPTGYVVETVPAALACWRAHPDDVRGAVTAAVRLGGDTDTVAAIAGALAGLTGPSSVPPDWLERLVLWPDGEDRMRELARRLAAGGEPLAERRVAGLVRNVLTGFVAVGHVVRSWVW